MIVAAAQARSSKATQQAVQQASSKVATEQNEAQAS
jgi:hypothetical protein